MKRTTVEERAAATLGREKFLPCRIVDGADLRDAVDLECERRAENRHAVRVVRRAVDRIEDPAWPRRAGRRPAQFLGEDGVIGKALGDERPKHALDCKVDLGDEIDLAFLVDLDGSRRSAPSADRRL